MSKFNWDDFPGYDKVAMDGDGCVYVFSGDIQYDFDDGVWFSLNPARNMLHVFTPSFEVLQGVVWYIERPDLPPDWWFEQQVKDGGITNIDFDGQEEGEQYIGAPGYGPTDLDVEEKTNRVWINAEEFNFAAYYYKMRHEDWMQSHESLMQHLGGEFAKAYNGKPYESSSDSEHSWAVNCITNSLATNRPDDWTVNSTQGDNSFPPDFGKSIYDKHAELARQSIWSHFEEFECLPDFLVGDTEVLGPYFMGIKVIDDEEDIC